MEFEAFAINTYKPADAAIDIAALQASDFEAIFNTYFKRVYNFISYRINNHYDTEELVSQVFEKVITKYATYDENQSPMEAWIIGIAKNVVNDYFRKQKRRIFIPLDAISEFLSNHGKPDEITVKHEENELLVKALNTLTQKERTIVAMKFAAQLKNKDIAQIMGLSDSNTGIILYRSINKLRKELEKMEGVQS